MSEPLVIKFISLIQFDKVLGFDQKAEGLLDAANRPKPIRVHDFSSHKLRLPISNGTQNIALNYRLKSSHSLSYWG